VFKRRILSASLALLVGVSAIAPWAASAVPAPDPAWEAYASAETGGPGDADESAKATQDAAPKAAGSREAEAAPRPKGNSFGRVLSAPFRALARLFGGGRKKSTTAAGRQAPTAEAARTRNPSIEARHEPGAVALTPIASPNSTIAGTGAVISPETVAPVGPVIPRGPVIEERRTEEGARVVRPGETGAPATLPKTFIPVIEGIGRDPLSQGRALLQHGYLNEAISELSVAATTVGPDSNLVEANNLLGLAHDRMGSHREAAEAYRRALTAAPADPVILANLGYSLYLSNDFDGALRHLKQAARLSPSLGVVHNNIGIVQARLGRYDEAFRSFARASNQYDAHLKVAGILEFEKRDRQAAKHYEAALRLQPNTSAVLERLVALYERTGQRDKAETARRALGQPANPLRTTTGGGG
jgi:Tfp pilus assembly protein PilF